VHRKDRTTPKPKFRLLQYSKVEPKRNNLWRASETEVDATMRYCDLFHPRRSRVTRKAIFLQQKDNLRPTLTTNRSIDYRIQLVLCGPSLSALPIAVSISMCAFGHVLSGPKGIELSILIFGIISSISSAIPSISLNRMRVSQKERMFDRVSNSKSPSTES
jgi:hypothetical protein